VFGVMRIVNVAHGEFFMLGAVFAWVCASLVGSPLGGFLFALVAAPIAVGAVALLADRLVLRRLDYHPEATIVATIGLLYIIQQAVLTLYGPDARPVAAPVAFHAAVPVVRILRLQARRRRDLRASPGCDLVAAREHAPRPIHARGTTGSRDGAGVRVPARRIYAIVFALGAMLAAAAACSSCRSSRRTT
jgi:branched-chain amino acid transport system permease protein